MIDSTVAPFACHPITLSYNPAVMVIPTRQEAEALFLQTRGFADAARIALTHSFPVQNARACAGEWDCSKEELQFVQDTLAQLEYDTYDHLLQLCDALAPPSGLCLIERRLIEVTIRRGVNVYTVPRWQAYMNIQKEFEAIIGKSIYVLLPGVVENTFGFTK